MKLHSFAKPVFKNALNPEMLWQYLPASSLFRPSLLPTHYYVEGIFKAPMCAVWKFCFGPPSGQIQNYTDSFQETHMPSE